MGIVASLLAPAASTDRGPLSDFWYQPIGPAVAAGVHVSGDTAMRVGAFWAAVNLRAKIVGSVPLHLYRRTGRDGLDRERATDHPLYSLLHTQPNRLQTSMQFRKHKEACRILRGNSYAYKVPRPDGDPRAPLALLPLNPDAVTPEKVVARTLPNGLPEIDLRYRVRLAGGGESILLADEVHHTIGFSFDGLIGVSVVEYAARQTIGTSLAIQEYGGRYFGNGARPGGILSPKSPLNQDSLDRLKAAWNQTFQGAANAHKIAALPVDVEYQTLSLSNEDSQFLETQEHLVRECARLLEIPPHMIGETTKETSWGSGIEAMKLGFTTFHVNPWLVDDEQALKRDLITEEDVYAEHDLEGLLRGDSQARANFFQTLRQNGIINGAQWARKENLPPPEGESGEAYWRPANMVDANAPPPPESEPAARPTPLPPREQRQAAHYARLLNETAERILRRETSELARHATRAAADPEGWRSAAEAFYVEHVGYIASALQVERSAAQRYCDAQQADVLRRGVVAIEDWKTSRAAALVALAMGGDA